MLPLYHSGTSYGKAFCADLAGDKVFVLAQSRHMADEEKDEPIPANRLKTLRQKRRLTQEQLAARIGTTHSTIQRLENSKRRLTSHWVYKLADALQCHPGELFREVPTSNLSASERLLIERYRIATERERAFIEATANAVEGEPAPSIPPPKPAKRAS